MRAAVGYAYVVFVRQQKCPFPIGFEYPKEISFSSTFVCKVQSKDIYIPKFMEGIREKTQSECMWQGCSYDPRKMKKTRHGCFTPPFCNIDLCYVS